MDWSPAWGHLPAELLMHITRDVSSSEGCLAATKTALRLVCRGWRMALPLGQCVPAKIWGWQDQWMDHVLGHQARNIEVLAPLPFPTSSPLPELARKCPHLCSLRLHHIHAAALHALAALTTLQMLDATVFFPDASHDWLKWVAGLVELQELRLTAVQMRLQPEAGLAALLPLRPRLTALRLDGCLVLTDGGVASLAQLSGLERLEITRCQLSQDGLDALAAALRRLAILELRLLDGVEVDMLLRETCVAAGGALAAHVSRTKASNLVSGAGVHMPGLTHLAVRHLEGGFLLTAPPSFLHLSCLESLSLPHIQLPADAVEQLAACSQLRELEVELNFTVKDEALLSWCSLARLHRLRLAGNFYLGEVAVAEVLGAMPLLQELQLEQLQGSGAILAPLTGMPALRSLELASCHINDAGALGASLRSASGLTCLKIRSCGIQSEVCEAVVAALAQLTALRELQLGLRRVLPSSTAEAIANGCSGLTQLTTLDLYFAAYTRDAPSVPTWRQLSTLAGLRRLHACTGLGWDAQAFCAVTAAATALRAVTITDNVGTVVDGNWMAALVPLSQLSQLLLNSCTRLGPEAASQLGRLTALTGLEAFRCPSLGTAETRQQLRDSLPCLASLSMQE